MSWYESFEQINGRGGTSIPDWRVCLLQILYRFHTLKEFFVHYIKSCSISRRIFISLHNMISFVVQRSIYLSLLILSFVTFTVMHSVRMGGRRSSHVQIPAKHLDKGEVSVGSTYNN